MSQSYQPSALDDAIKFTDATTGVSLLLLIDVAKCFANRLLRRNDAIFPIVV